MGTRVAKPADESKLDPNERPPAIRVLTMTDDDFQHLVERAAKRGAELALADAKKLAAAPLTKREAMAELHCSLTTINRCIADGSLKSVRIGKEVLITRESLDALLGGA